MQVEFKLAYQILKNIDDSMSNMNELVNDYSHNKPVKLSKSAFLLTLYALEEHHFILRYQQEGRVRYQKTQKGEAFYQTFRQIPQEEWPNELRFSEWED
ncbi:DUF3116 family protein [Listeria costaricensis]|uniref:DUF3116 family protein n=1 Tax=Listeria costaricensis TaxID=2026604 RepID=UPI000C0876A3|nr:DUF3116 family protein [Listeria costaricensis]